MEKGVFRPLIFKAFPLENASEAHRLMELGIGAGKMVVEIEKTGHPPEN